MAPDAAFSIIPVRKTSVTACFDDHLAGLDLCIRFGGEIVKQL